MKIESFKINVAVADGVKRGLLAQKAREALSGICFGVEIEDGSEQRFRNEDTTTIIRRGWIPAGGNAS